MCEACQKASRWQPALSLLNDLRQMPKTPDLGPYRAALVACDRGGEPLQAMWLLDACWKRSHFNFKRTLACSTSIYTGEHIKQDNGHS